MIRRAPVTLVSIIRCHSSVRPSSTGFGGITPAALTTRSTGPKARCTRSAAASTDEVKSKTYGVERVAHPLVGELVFPYETLGAAGDPDQCLVVYTPEPGSGTAERAALPAGRASAPSAPAG